MLTRGWFCTTVLCVLWYCVYSGTVCTVLYLGTLEQGVVGDVGNGVEGEPLPLPGERVRGAHVDPDHTATLLPHGLHRGNDGAPHALLGPANATQGGRWERKEKRKGIGYSSTVQGNCQTLRECCTAAH